MAEFKDWSAEDQDSWQKRYKQGAYAESPNAAPAPAAPAPIQAQPPGITAEPAAPAGGSDYPSLPPGATPPPGYHDPISGKTAPMAGAATAAAPAAPAAAAPAAPAAAAPAAPGAPPATIADAFKTSLIDTLNRGTVTPTLDDPTIKAQSDAFAVGQTRAREGAQAQMAERLAQQGLASSGAADQGLAGLYQAQGEAVGANNARLVGDEAQARRQQLLQGLAIAGNTLNSEEARKLQQELANLDAQIRREGIAQQGSLGQGDLSLRSRLGEGNLNLGLLGLLTGADYNNRSLAQNNSQFGQSLAQQGAQFGAGLDTQTILSLLGGL